MLSKIAWYRIAGFLLTFKAGLVILTGTYGIGNLDAIPAGAWVILVIDSFLGMALADHAKKSSPPNLDEAEQEAKRAELDKKIKAMAKVAKTLEHELNG